MRNFLAAFALVAVISSPAIAGDRKVDAKFCNNFSGNILNRIATKWAVRKDVKEMYKDAKKENKDLHLSKKDLSAAREKYKQDLYTSFDKACRKGIEEGVAVKDFKKGLADRVTAELEHANHSPATDVVIVVIDSSELEN
jgi:hypothetical protein